MQIQIGTILNRDEKGNIVSSEPICVKATPKKKKKKEKFDQEICDFFVSELIQLFLANK